MGVPEGTIAAISYARGVFLEQCRAEWAGLFWIGAELAILCAVFLARRHVEARLDPGGASRAPVPHMVGVAAAFVLLAAALEARFLWWPPVHARLEAGMLTEPEALRAAYRVQNHAHYSIWAVFVGFWVLLECAIVYQGWRVCAGVRKLLARPVAVAALLLLLALPATAQDASLLGALRAEDTADVLYRNALGLWLRVAGVVWIAVEWVAAVLLWRLYRFLRTVEARHD